MISIAVNTHNKSFLLPAVIDAIIRHTISPFELIIVYDGCSDKSEERINNLLSKGKEDIVWNDFDNERNIAFSDTLGFNRICCVKTLRFQNVFETICNNMAMKNANPQSVHYILLQDDMIVAEDGWDKRLLSPLKKFDDVFAVTGRNAFNFYPPDKLCDFREFCGRDEIKGPRGSFRGRRDTFYIRDVINRGPIAFDADKIRKLNYFDESFAPFHWDDVDLCFRAYKEFNWKCGSYHIDYLSDLCWGSNRINAGQSEMYGGSKSNNDIMNNAKNYQDISNTTWSRNLEIIYKRHMDMLEAAKHSEDRLVL